MAHEQTEAPEDQTADSAKPCQHFVLPCGVDDELELRIVIELKRKPHAERTLPRFVVQSTEGGSHGQKGPGLELVLHGKDREAAP